MTSTDRASVIKQRQQAMSLLSNGLFKESEPILREALEQTLDQKNAETFMWMQRLAQSLIGQGKFVEAEAHAQRALCGFRKFGNDDEDMLDCKCLLAESLLGQRKNSEAGEHAQSALEGMMSNSWRGPEHPTTLKCRGIMALALKSNLKFPEANALAKYNLECLETAVTKAEAIEASNSRRLTHFERSAFEKVESLAEKVLGVVSPCRVRSPCRVKSPKRLPTMEKSPKRVSTIETVSTHAPDSDGEESSRQSSRLASKELNPAPDFRPQTLA